MYLSKNYLLSLCLLLIFGLMSCQEQEGNLSPDEISEGEIISTYQLNDLSVDVAFGQPAVADGEHRMFKIASEKLGELTFELTHIPSVYIGGEKVWFSGVVNDGKASMIVANNGFYLSFQLSGESYRIYSDKMLNLFGSNKQASMTLLEGAVVLEKGSVYNLIQNNVNTSQRTTSSFQCGMSHSSSPKNESTDKSTDVVRTNSYPLLNGNPIILEIFHWDYQTFSSTALVEQINILLDGLQSISLDARNTIRIRVFDKTSVPNYAANATQIDSDYDYATAYVGSYVGSAEEQLNRMKNFYSNHLTPRQYEPYTIKVYFDKAASGWLNGSGSFGVGFADGGNDYGEQTWGPFITAFESSSTWFSQVLAHEVGHTLIDYPLNVDEHSPVPYTDIMARVPISSSFFEHCDHIIAIRKSLGYNSATCFDGSTHTWP